MPKRKGRRLPDVLTTDEQQALLQQPNPKSPTGLRNLCMIRLMLNAGLRVAEVLSLKVRDVDLNTGKLSVRQGKGGKDRILWLGESDLSLLQRWREKKPDSQLYFTTLAGGPLDARYMRQLVDRLAVKAGIQQTETTTDASGRTVQRSKVHPHTLRHTFATDLLRETKNIRLVQKALGHASIGTTEIYTHIVDDELESALKGFRSA